MTERPLLTTAEVADMLRMDRDTLSGWRARGYGPRSFKTGRRVKYLAADVEAWLEQQIKETAAGGQTSPRRPPGSASRGDE